MVNFDITINELDTFFFQSVGPIIVLIPPDRIIFVNPTKFFEPRFLNRAAEEETG